MNAWTPQVWLAFFSIVTIVVATIQTVILEYIRRTQSRASHLRMRSDVREAVRVGVTNRPPAPLRSDEDEDDGSEAVTPREGSRPPR